MRPGVYVGPGGAIILAMLWFAVALAIGVVCLIVLVLWLLGAGVAWLLRRWARLDER